MVCLGRAHSEKIPKEKMTGWWLTAYPSEKYHIVSWVDDSQLNGKITVMFQTTNQMRMTERHESNTSENSEATIVWDIS